MSARDWLDNARRRGVLDALDVMLAHSLVEKAGEENEQLLWLIALLSYQHRQGHVCIDLQRPPASAFDQPDCPWQVPSLESVQQYASPLVGGPGEHCPLVLDGPRLYLRRHWSAEQRVAQALRARCVVQEHDAAALGHLETLVNRSSDCFAQGADKKNQQDPPGRSMVWAEQNAKDGPPDEKQACHRGEGKQGPRQ